MNELTYQLLADVADGLGTDLYGWHEPIAYRTGEDDATTRSRVLGWIRASVEQDIMGLGSLEPGEDGRGRWSNWDGSAEERLERADARYRTTGTLWNVFATDTPRGMHLYSAERSRREAAGIDPDAHVDHSFEGIWDAEGNVIEPHGDEIVV
ncbi:hypothetical protein [Curtobacterium sp. NPDC089185]|jgi:hypothetical protein|uniref:hypothetical protein n=1 Tax=Curtobacterium sp. NPDC089185 TaxID=3154968 RepID=UPI0034296683